MYHDLNSLNFGENIILGLVKCSLLMRFRIMYSIRWIGFHFAVIISVFLEGLMYINLGCS